MLMSQESMDQLILFARFPRCGEGKTRLWKLPDGTPRLTSTQAWKLYQAFLVDLIGKLNISQKYQLNIMLGKANAGERNSFAEQHGLVPSQVHPMPGHTQDVGMLMEGCFQQFLAKGGSKVVVIGSDCPQLTKNVIEEAFLALDEFPVVMGPDSGGGIYLIGQRKSYGVLNSGITWSQGTDGEEVQERFQAQGLTVKLLGMEPDIDTPADLLKWAQKIQEENLTESVPRTWSVIQEHALLEQLTGETKGSL